MLNKVLGHMFLLTTPRLVLRHFRLADTESLDRVFGDPMVMLYGDGVQTREWVKDWLRTCIEQYEQRGYGPYAIVLRNSRDPIGYCGLFHFPDINGHPETEIGYRLARSTWGQGYATEAAIAVRDYAFAQLDLKRLVAVIDPSNFASIRVAEKLGMHYEQDVMFDGYTHPDRVYALARL